jgi:hypothetical protein
MREIFHALSKQVRSDGSNNCTKRPFRAISRYLEYTHLRRHVRKDRFETSELTLNTD